MVTYEEADVVVIGSGIGGLAAARAIAQFGKTRVLVLEQHYTLGGMTHEFSRAGRFQFGTGLHYISADGPASRFSTRPTRPTSSCRSPAWRLACQTLPTKDLTIAR
jgi:phytoene dehydrogenase-like protein